jgi:PD-(D/E)XK nuclease superfamily
MAVYGVAGARESRELARIGMTEIIYKNESYAIIGACFEVYNDKGCGFLEPDRAQLLNYLHATGFELGLLINFGHYPKLEYQRIARTQQLGQILSL